MRNGIWFYDSNTWNCHDITEYFDTVEPFWQEVLGISEGCLVRVTSPYDSILPRMTICFHKYPFFSEVCKSILCIFVMLCAHFSFSVLLSFLEFLWNVDLYRILSLIFLRLVPINYVSMISVVCSGTVVVKYNLTADTRSLLEFKGNF